MMSSIYAADLLFIFLIASVTCNPKPDNSQATSHDLSTLNSQLNSNQQQSLSAADELKALSSHLPSISEDNAMQELRELANERPLKQEKVTKPETGKTKLSSSKQKLKSKALTKAAEVAEGQVKSSAVISASTNLKNDSVKLDGNAKEENEADKDLESLRGFMPYFISPSRYSNSNSYSGLTRYERELKDMNKRRKRTRRDLAHSATEAFMSKTKSRRKKREIGNDEIEEPAVLDYLLGDNHAGFEESNIVDAPSFEGPHASHVSNEYDFPYDESEYEYEPRFKRNSYKQYENNDDEEKKAKELSLILHDLVEPLAVFQKAEEEEREVEILKQLAKLKKLKELANMLVQNSQSSSLTKRGGINYGYGLAPSSLFKRSLIQINKDPSEIEYEPYYKK